MALSLLAGREVDTSSEEWRLECEVAYLLDLPEAKRRDLIDGPPGSTGDARGIRGKRSDAAAAMLWAQVERLRVLRAAQPKS